MIGTLRALYRLKHFLPVSTKALLVQALILPVIDYADICFSNVSQDLLNKLDRLLNSCIRFIFGLRKYDHVSFYRSKLNWLPIRQRRNVRILCALFSILFDPNSPSYLKSKFQFCHESHSRNLRSVDTLSLLTPLHSSGFMSSSFRISAIRLWNALPINIRKSISKFSFKRSLRKHYSSLPSQ